MALSTNSEGLPCVRARPAAAAQGVTRPKTAPTRLLSCVLCLLAVLLTGCSLPGLSDATARYTLGKGAPADVGHRVRARLGVAHLSADVTREGDTLVVRATKERLELIVGVLALPSGLSAHALPERCAPSCDGPLDGAASPPGHAASEVELVLRPAHGAPRTVAARVRPRELAARDLVVMREGPELVLDARPGTPAALVLGTEELVVLASGKRAFYIGKPAGHPVVLHFGDGIEAYERAHAMHDLLSSPELPALGAPTIEPAPRDLGLAGFSLVLPVLLSIVYVGFVRRFDRAHPEPLGLVGITFVLGALSAELAGLAEWACVSMSAWTTPQLLTFGGRMKALPLSTIGFALLVGVPEEGAKLLATLYATRRRAFDEPVDGVVYGAVSALGFAAAENIVYFASGRASATLIVGRAFTAIPVHVFLSGLWGYALGARLVRPKTRVLPWFLAAALLHGAYDAAMSTEGGFAFGMAIVVGLAVSFVVLLRASLRHGPVSDATVRAAALARRVHAFGRGPVFPALAVLLPVLAAVLLGVSSAWESTGGTARSPYTWPMVLLVVAIAAVLWGITSTLPLDAVVDAHGVTFAGAVRAFEEIDATVVHGEYLEVASSRGDIEIGPGPRGELEALASEIQEGRDAGSTDPQPDSRSCLVKPVD